MIIRESDTMAERVAKLQVWVEANAENPYAMIDLDQETLAHLLEPPAYHRQTSEAVRKQVMWTARGRMPGAEWYGLCSMLEDLQNAEAALKGGEP